MKPIAPEYIDQKLRLSWNLICKTACQAMILKISFEEAVAMAMREVR